MQDFDEKNINGNKYISMQKASKLCSYSQEYLSLLARRGKISAKKIGRNWYITETALQDYLKKQSVTFAMPKNILAKLTSALTPEEPEAGDDLHVKHSKVYEEFEKLNPQIFKKEKEQPFRDLRVTPPASFAKTNTPGDSQKNVLDKLDKLSDSLGNFAERITRKIEEPKETLTAEQKEFFAVESESLSYRFKKFDRYARSMLRSPVRMMAIMITAIVFLFVMVGGFSFGQMDYVVQQVRQAFKDADTLQGHFPGTHANEVLVLDKAGNVSIFGHIETQGQLRSYAPDGVAPIVVDSVTKIENLNADYFDNLDSKDFTLAFVTKNGNLTYEDVYLEGAVEVGKSLTVKGATKLMDSLQVYGSLGVFGEAVFSKNITLTGGDLVLKQGTIKISNTSLIKNLNAEMLEGIRKQNINLDFVTSNGASTGNGITIGALEVDGQSDFNGMGFFYKGVWGSDGSFGSVGAGNATFGDAGDEDDHRFEVYSKYFTVDSSGNATISGDTNTAGLIVSKVISDLVPSGSYDLGSSDNRWENLFATNINITGSFTASGSVNFSGTSSTSFTINTDNTSSDSEDAYLSFERGTTTPNATLRWNSSSNRFEFNEPVFISSSSAQTIFSVSGGPASISNTLFVENTGAVGIGTVSPNSSAILDLTSTTRGFLPPRMDQTQRDAIGTPAAGLLVFNTTTSQYNLYNGTTWLPVGALKTEEGGTVVLSNGNSLDFNDGAFALVASGSTETIVKIDYANGPASRSINQTITGIWNFSNGASVSGSFEVGGTASTSAITASGLLSFTGTNHAGLRLNNLTTAQRDLLTGVSGMTLFNTSVSKMQVYNGTTWKNVGNPEIGEEVTGGTAGSVLFVDGSGNLGQDNSNFYWDVTNRRLGIGTGTPSTKFEVQGTASASYGLFGNTIQVGGYSSVSYNRFGTDTTGYSNFISASNDVLVSGDLEVNGSANFDTFLRVGTNNAPALFANAVTGNVGIGTTSPLAKLHIRGAGWPDSFAYLDTTAAGQDSGIRFYENGSVKSHIYHASSGDLLNIYGSGTTGISITSTGYVGIGTTDPKEKLHVSGALKVTGQFFQDTASSGGIDYTGGTTRFFSWGSDDSTRGAFEFRTVSSAGGLNTIPMVITSGNFIGIGTTSPSTKLEVQGTASASYGLFGNTIQVAGFSSASYNRFGTDTTGYSNFISESNDVLVSGDLEVNGSANFDGFLRVGNGSTPALIVQSSNGNVGIGTSNPISKLHIDGGNLYMQDNYIYYQPVIGTKLDFYGSGISTIAMENGYTMVFGTGVGQGIGTFRFTTGTGEIMRLNNGNVGIGDTSPDYQLEIHNATSTPALVLSDDDVIHGLTELAETDVFSYMSSLSTLAGGTQWTSISDMDAQALSIRAVIGSTDPTDSTPAIKFIGAKSNGTTGMADLAATETVFQIANNDNTADFTILGNGNVGIGTTSPETKFELVGTASISGNLYVGGFTQVNGLTSSSFEGPLTLHGLPLGTSINQGSLYINPATAGVNNVILGVAVGGSEKLRIDAEGDVQTIGLFNSTNSSGTNQLSGNFQVDGNTTLGSNASDTVTVNGLFNSHLLPSADITYNLGSPDLRWESFYVASLSVSNLMAGGTSSNSFIINEDNATNDGEDSQLEFERGTATPNAILKWDSANDRFDFNYPVSLQGTLLGQGTSSSSFAGPVWFTGLPTGTGISNGSVYVNPGSGATNNTLFSVAVAGVERMRVDAEGDTTIQGDLGVENQLYDITEDTLRINDDLQINGNDIKDSGTNIRLTLGSTTSVTATTTDLSGDLEVSGSDIRDSDGTNRITFTTNGATGMTSVTGGLTTSSYLKSDDELVVTNAAQFAGTSTVAYSRFGTAATGHGLSAADDVLISGKLEVNGTTHFDGTVNFAISSSSYFYAQPGTAASPSFAFTSDQDTGMFNPALNELGFSTLGAERVRVDNAGNVGIGTTDPGNLLNVYKSFNSGAGGGAVIMKIEGQSVTDNDYTLLDLYDRSTHLVRFQGNGNIGVGTTSAAQKLHVVGNIISGDRSDNLSQKVSKMGSLAYNTTQNPFFTVISTAEDGTNSLFLGGGANDGQASQVIRFYTTPTVNTVTGTERMRIDNAGNVGIGTTTTAGLLDVVGNLSGNTNPLFRVASASELFRINENGNVGVGTTGPRSLVEASSGATTLTLTSTTATASTSIDFLPAGGATTGNENKFTIRAGGLASTAGERLDIINGAGTKLVTVASAGNVGVGTTAPSQLIEVYGSSSPTIQVTSTHANNGGRLILESSLGSWTQYVQNNHLRFYDTADRLTLQAGGNIGIGSTAPGAMLDILTNAGNGDMMRISSASGVINFVVKKNGNVGIGTTTTDYKLNVAGDLDITGSYRVNGVAQNFASKWTSAAGDDIYRLTGNVGIGTSSPTTKFDVIGNASISLDLEIGGNLVGGTSVSGNFDPTTDNTYSLGDASYRWKDINVGPGSFNISSTTGTSGAGSNYTLGQISFSGSSLSFGTYDQGTGNGGSLEFKTASTSRMFISSGGNVGIGTTGAVRKLHLHESSAGNNLTQITNTDTGATSTDGLIVGIGATEEAYLWNYENTDLHLGTNNSTRLFIKSDGNIGIGTTSPVASLDIEPASTYTGPLFRVASGSNEALRITSAGNVGIGTTGPLAVFHVKTATDKNIYFRSAVEGGDGIGLAVVNDANSAFKDLEIKASAFHLLSGNVGIGTTGPATQLDVRGVPITGTGDLRANIVAIDTSVAGSGVGGGISFGGKYAAAGSVANTFAAIKGIKENATDNNYAGALSFITRANGGNPTERMRIDSAGNVGIGTTAANWKLLVQDTGITDLGLPQLMVGSAGGTSNYALIGFGWTNTGSATKAPVSLGYVPTVATGSTYGDLVFNLRAVNTDTSPTEKMRLDSAGRLFINDTANSNMNIGLTINQGENDSHIITFKSSDVAHGITDQAETDTWGGFYKAAALSGGIAMRGFSEDTNALALMADATNDDTTKSTAAVGYAMLFVNKKSGTNIGATGADANLFVIRNFDTSRYIFDAEGSAHADVEWTTFSDERLKSDIADIPYGLNELNQLRPRIYTKRSGSIDANGNVVLEDNPRRMIGFVAQDVKPIIPELVEDVDTTKSFYSLDDGKLAAVIVKSVQELDTKFNALASGNYEFTVSIASGSFDTLTADSIDVFDLSAASASANVFCLQGDCRSQWPTFNSSAFALQSSVSSQFSIFNSQFSNLTASVSAFENSIIGNSLEIENSKLKIAALNAASSSFGLRLSSLENYDIANSLEIENLKLEIGNLSLASSSMDLSAYALQSDLQSLNSQFSIFSSQSMSQFSVLNSDIAGLTASSSDYSLRIGSLENTVASNSASIENLKLKIGNSSASGTITGNLIPDADVAYDLGSPTMKFANIYGYNIVAGDVTYEETTSALNGATLQTGDLLGLYVNSTAGGTHTVPITLTDAFGNLSGNLGIGTTTAGAKLEVNGGIKIKSGSGGGITFADGTVMTSAAGSNAGDSSIGDVNLIADTDVNGSGAIHFNTGSTNKMTLLNNGNVGIGTAVPTAKFELLGTAGDNAIMNIASSSGTSVFKITKAGNIGIGSTSPAYTFDVAGTGRFTGAFNFGSSASVSTNFEVGGYASVGGNGYFGGNVGIGTTAPIAALDIEPISSYTGPLFRVASGSNEALRITSAGNVGIGATSPNYNLQINKASANANSLVQFTNNSTGSASSDGFRLGLGTDNAAYLYMAENSPMHFATNATVNMTVASSGYVGIGTTAPGALLEVSNASGNNNSTLRLSDRETSDSAGVAYLEFGNIDAGGWTRTGYVGDASGSDSDIYLDNTASGDVIIQSSAGNVGIGDTDPTEKLIVKGTSINIGLQAAASSQVLGLKWINSADADISSITSNTGVGDLIFNPYGAAAAVTMQATTGNVGIGTTGPLTLTHIRGANSNSLGNVAPALLTLESTTAAAVDVGPAITFGGASGNAITPYAFGKIMGAKESATAANYSGYLSFWSVDSVGSPTERMRILGNGNVGIGTTTPGSLFHIQKNQDAQTITYIENQNSGVSAAGRLDIVGGQSRSSRALTLAQYSGNATDTLFGVTLASTSIVFDNTTGTANKSKGLLLGTNSSTAPIVFGTAGSERMRIEAGGNVGIGTTASDISKLHVYTGSAGTISPYVESDLTIEASDHAVLQILSPTANEQYIMFGAPHASGLTANRGYIMYSHATDDLYLQSSGTVTSNANIRVTTGKKFVAKYDGTDNYHGGLYWNVLQLGNNGDNWIVGGRTGANGGLKFVVNNTANVDTGTAHNGTLAMTIANNANITFANYTAGACCSDVAEFYESSEAVASSDVMAIDPSNPGKLRKAQNGDTIIGVVSTNPAIAIEDEHLLIAGGQENYVIDPMKPVVALAGRVPVKVSEENGQIHAGDRLTLSTTLPGYAMKMTQPGQSIGIALSDSSGTGGVSSVLTFVSLGYSNPANIAESTGQPIASGSYGFMASASFNTINTGNIFAGIGSFGDICLGGDCRSQWPSFASSSYALNSDLTSLNSQFSIFSSQSMSKFSMLETASDSLGFRVSGLEIGSLNNSLEIENSKLKIAALNAASSSYALLTNLTPFATKSSLSALELRVFNLENATPVSSSMDLSSYALKSDLTPFALQASVSALSSSLLTLDSSISSLTASVSDHESRLTALESAPSMSSIQGTVTGSLIPDAHLAYDLGSPTMKFANIYGYNIVAGDVTYEETTSALNGATLQTGDLLGLYVNSTAGGTHTVPILLTDAFGNLSGNLGIGTTTAGAKLEVNGGIKIKAGSGGGITFADGTVMTSAAGSNAGDSSIGDVNLIADTDVNGSGAIHFNTGSTNKMTLLNNGNVGIGTAVPTAKFELLGTAGDNAIMNIASSSGTSVFKITKAGNVGIGTTAPTNLMDINHVGANTIALKIGDTDTIANATGIYLRSSGTAYLGTHSAQGDVRITADTFGANSNGITIKTGGNVGIGTTGPIAALDIEPISSYTGPLFRVASGSNEALRITSDGNVGIGTTSVYATNTPGKTVEIYNSSAPSELIMSTGLGSANRLTGISFRDSDAETGSTQPAWFVGRTTYSFASKSFGIFEDHLATSARLVIAKGGNVGIGTTAPAAKLQIGASALGYMARFDLGTSDPSSSAAATGMLALESGSGTQLRFGSMVGSPYTAWIQHQHSSNNGSYFNLSLQPLGGNVGIGTTGPDHLLHIRSTTQSSEFVEIESTAADSNPHLEITNDARSWGVQVVGARNDNFEIMDYTSSNSVPKVTVQASTGNVGIGTTGPESKMHVYSGSAGTVTAHTDVDDLVVEGSTHAGINILTPDGDSGGIYFGTASLNREAEIWWDDNANTNGTFSFITRQTSSRIQMMAVSGGVELTAGATSWSAISDERLKNINGPIENGLLKLSALRPIYYTLKSDSLNVNHIGLIAQDVQQVFPEAVSTNADGYLTLRYTELIPPIIKAVQELDTRTASQSSAFEQLQARVASLSFTVDNLLANQTSSSSENITVTSGNLAGDIMATLINTAVTQVQTLWAKGDVISEGIKKTYYSVASAFNWEFDMGVMASNWMSREITFAADIDSATASLFSGPSAQAADESKLDLVESGAYLATYGVDSARGDIVLSGSSDLVGGEAKIFFDFSFTSVISDKIPLKVLLTPTTFMQGQMYVEQKTVNGFVVKGINGATEGKFDWLVIARRKGYEGTDTISNSQFPISNEFSNTNELNVTEPTPTPDTTTTTTTSAPSPADSGSTELIAPATTPSPTPEPTPDTTTTTPAPSPADSGSTELIAPATTPSPTPASAPADTTTTTTTTSDTTVTTDPTPAP